MSSLEYNNISLENGNILIGFGCMMSWIGLIRYMESSENYSILSKTLSLAMPKVLRTLVMIIPVLLGYTFLGVCLFSHSLRFGSTASALFALYTLMCGDMIYLTYYDISST